MANEVCGEGTLALLVSCWRYLQLSLPAIRGCIPRTHVVRSKASGIGTTGTDVEHRNGSSSGALPSWVRRIRRAAVWRCVRKLGLVPSWLDELDPWTAPRICVADTITSIASN